MPAFLCVPLKRTSEVDLARPLKNFISSTYSSSDKPVDDSPCDELDKLRNKALIQPLDKHESSLDVLYRYYDQLTAIEGKLPLTASTIPVNFKWKNAFDKGSLLWGKESLSLPAGSYERACVLFNIAALQSQIAGAQSLDGDDELKTAAKMLQLSAGIFHSLSETILGLVQADPTADLHPDTLAALHALMLAQAQEAVYFKAAKDMKPQVCAKIAAQAADLYTEAGRLMAKEAVKGVLEKEWQSQVGGKVNAFLGLAQFQQAKLNKEKKEIGEELARLAEADKRMTAARTALGSASSHFQTEGNAIAKAHELARKDNDFIYHERIPDLKSLAAIGKANVAKALPVAKPMSPNFKDLFAAMVPVAVHQALHAFDLRRTEIINGETTRLRDATQVLNATLASLNLPAALDDAVGGVKVPESLAQKASRIQSAGGIDSLRRMQTELPGLLARNREILEETTRVLTEEKEADTQLRNQYKEKWTRVQSDTLTKSLWEEIGRYRGMLDIAQGADAKVKAKYDQHLQSMELLSKAGPELEAAIPAAGGGGGGATPIVRQLQELMSQVEVLKAKREQLEADLKGTTLDMSDVFLRALAESGAVNEEPLSLEKLNEAFGPKREAVTASLKEGEELMASVTAANAQFASSKTGDGAARETVLKNLAAAHDAFMELRSHLQEGTKFYNDLTPLLVRLQQKVSDFAFARKTEKEDLLKDVTGGSGGAGAPPPRPPPPNPTTAARPAPPPPAASSAPSPYPAASNNPFAYATAGTTSTPAAAPPPPQQPPYPMPNYGAPQTQPGYNPYATYPGAAAQQPYPAQQPAQPYPMHQAMGQPQAPYGYPGYPAPPPAMPAGYNPYAAYNPQAQPYPPQQPPPGQ